jgi:nucleoside-diphosphate-sugar epimerase
VALLDAIALIESLLDREVAVGHAGAANGDPRRTEADVTRAARDLAYRPATPLAEGLAAQVDAVRDLVRTGDLVA